MDSFSLKDLSLEFMPKNSADKGGRSSSSTISLALNLSISAVAKYKSFFRV